MDAAIVVHAVLTKTGTIVHQTTERNAASVKTIILLKETLDDIFSTTQQICLENHIYRYLNSRDMWGTWSLATGTQLLQKNTCDIREKKKLLMDILASRSGEIICEQ